MSFLARIFGRLGGRSRSSRKQEAARRNLEQARRIATSSPDAMVQSLGDQGAALERIFMRTRSRAKRYPDIHDFPDSWPMAERIRLRGNTNVFGELPEFQVHKANQAIRALGLTEDAEDAAGLFVQKFVSDGMDAKGEFDVETTQVA